MSQTETAIRERLSALAPLALELIDDSAKHAGHEGARSGGGHYNLSITSQAFAGLSTLARHRLVYQTLGDLMQGKIHALSIIARAPNESPVPSSPAPSTSR